MPRVAPLLLALTVTFAGPPVSSGQSVADVAADYAPEIAAAARRDALAIRECLDRAPRGTFDRLHTVSLQLDAGGHVLDLVLHPSTPPARQLRACLLPVARTWQLSAPTPRAPILLSYAAPELRAAIGQL